MRRANADRMRTVDCERSNSDGQHGGSNADSRKRRLRMFEIGCG